MAEESDLEKTESPSGRRLEKAREEGQVPQSRELVAFLVMAVGTATLWAMSGWYVRRSENIVRHALTFERRQAFDVNAMGESLLTLSTEAMTILAPIFFATMAVIVFAPFLFGGWNFTTKTLMLDFSKMNPINGLKKIISLSGLAEMVKGILKALLMGFIVWWVVRHERDNFMALLSQPLETALLSFGNTLMFAFIAFVSLLALIALIDVPFQLWNYYKGLRMSKEEVKQEGKEMEGDPQIKARIRSQQREIARKRMMSEVPKADVVVTNPTHFAVALKYDKDKMGAPQVVAKGMNLVAAKIRELASENNVPVIELPPLARALYRHVEIGEGVPTALYTAVAEVMAYIYQLNTFMTQGTMVGILPPQAPVAVSMPDGLDPGAID